MHLASQYNSRPNALFALMKQWLKKPGFLCLLFALSLSTLHAAEGDSPVTVTNQPEAAIGSNDIERAYTQLQGQILDTQFAVIHAREEFHAAAAQEAITTSNRLQAVQESLLLQRTELAEARHMNSLLAVVVGVFAVVIFAAAGLAVYFQSRAMNRISAELSASRGMVLALSPGGTVQLRDKALSNGAVEQSNGRLLSLVEVLEKRIGDLEQTAGVRVKKGEAITNGHTQRPAELILETSKDVTVPNDVAAPKNMTTPNDVTAGWMERAQSLLAADLPEDAMAYFDAILVTEPTNGEALRKKGMALEKMNRPQEALECYNRAIAAVSDPTMAHLQKGALCSQLEKHSEALESYEKALDTREKEQVA